MLIFGVVGKPCGKPLVGASEPSHVFHAASTWSYNVVGQIFALLLVPHEPAIWRQHAAGHELRSASGSAADAVTLSLGRWPAGALGQPTPRSSPGQLLYCLCSECQPNVRLSSCSSTCQSLPPQRLVGCRARCWHAAAAHSWKRRVAGNRGCCGFSANCGTRRLLHRAQCTLAHPTRRKHASTMRSSALSAVAASARAAVSALTRLSRPTHSPPSSRARWCGSATPNGPSTYGARCSAQTAVATSWSASAGGTGTALCWWVSEQVQCCLAATAGTPSTQRSGPRASRGKGRRSA